MVLRRSRTSRSSLISKSADTENRLSSVKKLISECCTRNRYATRKVRKTGAKSRQQKVKGSVRVRSNRTPVRQNNSDLHRNRLRSKASGFHKFRLAKQPQPRALDKNNIANHSLDETESTDRSGFLSGTLQHNEPVPHDNDSNSLWLSNQSLLDGLQFDLYNDFLGPPLYQEIQVTGEILQDAEVDSFHDTITFSDNTRSTEGAREAGFIDDSCFSADMPHSDAHACLTHAAYFPMLSCVEPSLLERKLRILSCTIQNMALLNVDLCTIDTPNTYWRRYGGVYDGVSMLTYLDPSQGIGRLTAATDALSSHLADKSVRLITTILRIAFMDCAEADRPWLNSTVAFLAAQARYSEKTAHMVGCLEAICILMHASLREQCHFLKTVLNLLIENPEVSFLATFELWELYITRLRAVAPYAEADYESWMLWSHSKRALGEFSGHTYRAQRLCGRVALDRGNIALAYNTLLDVMETYRDHMSDYEDNRCPVEWHTAEDLYKVCLRKGLPGEAAIWLRAAIRFSKKHYRSVSSNNYRLQRHWNEFARKYGRTAVADIDGRTDRMAQKLRIDFAIPGVNFSFD